MCDYFSCNGTKMNSKLEDALRLLERNDPALTSLDLQQLKINSEGTRRLSEALAQNSTLRLLYLQQNKINSEGALRLSEALTQNSTLRFLNLRQNKINSEGTRHLSENLVQNSTLISLNLCENNIGSKGAYSLSRALRQNSTLTKLDLGNNNIGYKGAYSLSRALRQNSTLTDLDLGNNNIGFKGAYSLSRALLQNSTLKYLTLSYNEINSDVVRYLSEALMQNNTLISLYLDNNNIGSKGARYLSEALMQGNTLISLYLWGNNIDSKGARYLSKALMQNNTLISLSLWGNNIGPEGARYLSETLVQNHHLSYLSLGYNWIDQSNKKLAFIKEKLSQNQVVRDMMKYKYLTQKQRKQVKRTLNTLGLRAIHLSDEPLTPKMLPFFHTLFTDLTRASRHKPYTAMILPFSYAREIDLLRIFISINSPDDILWLSKEGFCFSLVKLIDHKVMDRPYVCPEWNIFFDPESEIEPDRNWINRLSYAVEILIETLGFLPHLSFQYSGLNSKDLRDLLTFLATDPPIEHLDLSHNPIMLKKWNRPKTQKVIRQNTAFNHLRQLTGNTQLRHLDLSHTQITLDQKDYPQLLPIFDEQPNLVIDFSGNYVSNYIRWKDNNDKEKTSKALCRFFQGLPPEDGSLRNDPLNNFFKDLCFERTEPFENGFFQAMAFCLRQDENELKTLFKAFVLEHASIWQNDLASERSVEDYLRQLEDDELPLPHTLTLMSRFLDAPLVILSSESTPVISNEYEDLSGNPLFLYQDEEQHYHALTYEEDFNAKNLLSNVVSAEQLGVSALYDKRRTQSEYLELNHGFWSERKPLLSVFSVLPKHQGLTLNDHTQRHVALCCLNTATGKHTWVIIEGMHHFGQAFFLCAELSTNDNRTTQINIHAEFCPHRFKEGLLKGKIIARVYPGQPKERIKALLRRVEEEHEHNPYRYGSTGGNRLITSNPPINEEEQRAKTVNCMKWAIELLLDYDIIDQEEAGKLRGNVLRYWPINARENTPCCVM